MKRPPAPSALGFWQRLAHTPLSDLMRGHVKGRYDARRQAACADLPPELLALVLRTAHGTRLHHAEQHEIAGQLIAYFQECLVAGDAPLQAAARFGDATLAAGLLRTAYLARRSRSHRAWRRTVQYGLAGTALVLLLAIALVVRYRMGTPTISRDYLAEMDEPARLVPEADRAWPLYRAALLSLEKFPDNEDELSEQAYWHSWPQIATYLQRNRPAFELARQAAGRRRFGFYYGHAEDSEWLTTLHGMAPESDHVGPLHSLPSPHLDDLSRLRQLLLADSCRALAQADSQVFCSNIHTLLGMAEHLRHGAPSAATELQAFACFSTSLQLMGMMLEEHASVLANESLQDLAHRLAAYSGGGTLRARLQGEHLLFEDLLQRTFTDDGSGDGRLTADGYRMWRQQRDDLPDDYQDRLSWWGRGMEPLDGTALSLATASRRELSDLAERLLLRFQAERSGPLWQWDTSSAEQQIEQIAASSWQQIRYWPVQMIPDLRKLALRGEVLTQQRDAMLAAIALELYRRRAGQYPTSLEQLTPSPLPSVPLDRFTGKPLCYRLTGAQPLVYSTGMDRDDDGGRPHRMGNDLAERWEPWNKVSAPPRRVNDGFGRMMLMGPKFDWDWILWPQPMFTPQVESSKVDSSAGS